MNIWVDANGWPIPPMILLGCLLAEFLFFRGWHKLLMEIETEKAVGTRYLPSYSGFEAPDMRRSTWIWRGTFFLAAIVTFLLAASAPIDNLSSQLFWVHMIQHLLLLIIVTPLLVASAPLLPLWLGLPEWGRNCFKALASLRAARILYALGSWLRQPVISCALFLIGIWIWHWPYLYDLALTNDLIHDWCEHTIFLVVSLFFWSQIIPSAPFRPQLGYLGRLGCVGFAIIQNLVLAVLLGFAPAPLYTPYIHLNTLPGSLTTLQDQQFGAGFMWTFGDIPFGIALAILIQRWLATQSGETGQEAQETPG
jgi:cytochrome c oxidase assembly factor CtaG